MDYAQQQRNPGKHIVGIGFVVAMHLLLGYGLLTGLAQRMVEVIRAPIETKIIDDIKPPPPPPPENLPPPPKFAPPPPSYVPPPEVQVQLPPTPAPTITVTVTPPPPAPPVFIQPPPPPQAVVAPAPPAPPPAPPAPPPRVPVRVEPKLNFNACAKPEYPTAARRSGAEGSVIVDYTMDVTGTISEAKIVKGSGFSREHRQLDAATLEAVKACKGVPGALDGKPEKLSARIEYVWKLTD